MGDMITRDLTPEERDVSIMLSSAFGLGERAILTVMCMLVAEGTRGARRSARVMICEEKGE